jgi:hypothetical protein
MPPAGSDLIFTTLRLRLRAKPNPGSGTKGAYYALACLRNRQMRNFHQSTWWNYDVQVPRFH